MIPIYAPPYGCDLTATIDGCDLKAASDGCDLKAASDGCDLKEASDGGDLDREDAPTAEYTDDRADLHREADTSGLSAWILLDPVSYIVGDGDLRCDNETTAEAETISWREDGVKVSFFTANPPCASHFSIHIPSLVEKPYLLCGRPTILYTVRNLALISITFDGYKSETEYYLYEMVGPGRRPSLVHLEYISEQLKEVEHVVSVGLLPRNDELVLAALTVELSKEEQYGLHVFFQSEQGTWTCQVHMLQRHQIGNIQLYNVEKVIALSDKELGFVDLWNGIVVFDVLQKHLNSRYIPLPKLLPGNHSHDQLGLSAKCFRDVIFSTDGLIKCVELEMCWKHVVHEKARCTESQDVWERDILYDVDLMQQQIVVDEKEEVEETFEYLGWRFICWCRKPHIAGWRKDCSFHVNDIVNTTKSQLNELFVYSPTLSIDGSTLYVVSKVLTSDLESRVIVVDLGKASLKELSPFPNKRPDLFLQAYIVCDLFKCMNIPSDESILSSDESQLYAYDNKALFLTLFGFKHENIFSIRTSQCLKKPSEGAAVGLQLILSDDPVGLQLIPLDDRWSFPARWSGQFWE